MMGFTHIVTWCRHDCWSIPDTVDTLLIQDRHVDSWYSDGVMVTWDWSAVVRWRWHAGSSRPGGSSHHAHSYRRLIWYDIVSNGEQHCLDLADWTFCGSGNACMEGCGCVLCMWRVLVVVVTGDTESTRHNLQKLDLWCGHILLQPLYCPHINIRYLDTLYIHIMAEGGYQQRNICLVNVKQRFKFE